MSQGNSCDEYDGPIMNGHPILRSAEVQAWFNIAGCFPSEEAVLPLVRTLNEYEFVGFFWKNTSVLRAQRWRDSSVVRNVRIAAALKTLQSELPTVIEATLRVFPDARTTERLRPIIELLDSVNSIAPRFQRFQKRRGRQPDLWHTVARKIGAEILEILHAHGHRVGLGKPTSPAIEILRKGLVYLDVHQSPEAIVDAVRKPRRRARRAGGENRALIPQTPSQTVLG
jgi:hypothetical protein